MVLVIDTSSATSTLALLRPSDPGWEAMEEAYFPSGRGEGLTARVRQLVPPAQLSGVAVAVGPGSFTGLRVGVSYGVGLAMGLKIPLYGLGSLELVAARSKRPILALSEAGRERLYYLPPGGELGHGEAMLLPQEWPAWGLLQPATVALVEAAGMCMLTENEIDSFALAAARIMTRAEPLEYSEVKLHYAPAK
ncbi:MAG: tRNA (adenosine(37)-N6)-threonylcarbamoyltransferase complex dimerization subunit type 1 TsaB [Candidatus Dormibacteraceae bacterium]